MRRSSNLVPYHSAIRPSHNTDARPQLVVPWICFNLPNRCTTILATKDNQVFMLGALHFHGALLLLLHDWLARHPFGTIGHLNLIIQINEYVNTVTSSITSVGGWWFIQERYAVWWTFAILKGYNWKWKLYSGHYFNNCRIDMYRNVLFWKHLIMRNGITNIIIALW